MTFRAIASLGLIGYLSSATAQQLPICTPAPKSEKKLFATHAPVKLPAEKVVTEAYPNPIHPSVTSRELKRYYLDSTPFSENGAKMGAPMAGYGYSSLGCAILDPVSSCPVRIRQAEPREYNSRMTVAYDSSTQMVSSAISARAQGSYGSGGFGASLKAEFSSRMRQKSHSEQTRLVYVVSYLETIENPMATIDYGSRVENLVAKSLINYGRHNYLNDLQTSNLLNILGDEYVEEVGYGKTVNLEINLDESATEEMRSSSVSAEVSVKGVTYSGSAAIAIDKMFSDERRRERLEFAASINGVRAPSDFVASVTAALKKVNSAKELANEVQTIAASHLDPKSSIGSGNGTQALYFKTSPMLSRLGVLAVQEKPSTPTDEVAEFIATDMCRAIKTLRGPLFSEAFSLERNWCLQQRISSMITRAELDLNKLPTSKDSQALLLSYLKFRSETLTAHGITLSDDGFVVPTGTMQADVWIPSAADYNYTEVSGNVERHWADDRSGDVAYNAYTFRPEIPLLEGYTSESLKNVEIIFQPRATFTAWRGEHVRPRWDMATFTTFKQLRAAENVPGSLFNVTSRPNPVKWAIDPFSGGIRMRANDFQQNIVYITLTPTSFDSPYRVSRETPFYIWNIDHREENPMDRTKLLYRFLQVGSPPGACDKFEGAAESAEVPPIAPATSVNKLDNLETTNAATIKVATWRPSASAAVAETTKTVAK